MSVRGLGLALVLGLLSCANLDTRFDRSELDNADAGIVLGEFPLLKNAIVDGDTIKVDGLGASLRLLCIDTEETFKNSKDWRAFEVGWEQYLQDQQAKTSRPIKVPTPVGMEAKYWAQDFFAGVTSVRLERDHPKEVRGRYNRFLVYVLVERDGQWLNYNVESVRAGMSPYFTKYGYSRRYHEEFLAAEAEARAARRGIWSDGAQCYQDYDLRIEWWNNRAEFVRQFELDAAERPELINLTHWDALAQLEDRLGDEVELLGAVAEIRQSERGPKRVLLSRRMFSDFPLTFHEEDVFEESGIARYRGEFVRVRGVVTKYTDRRTGRPQLQIEVRDPIQIRLPDYVPPGDPGSADVDPEFDVETDEEALEPPPDLKPAPDDKPKAPPVEPEPVEAEPSEPEPVEAEPVEPDVPPPEQPPSLPPEQP